MATNSEPIFLEEMSTEDTGNKPVSCSQLQFQQNDDNFNIQSRKDVYEDLNDLNSSKDLDKVHSTMPNEMIPTIDMEFDSEEKAWQYYLEYAKRVGFSARKSKSHNDKYGNLIARTFCCSAQGKREKHKRDATVKAHRAETRFGCQARLRLHTRWTKKFRVIEFVQEHNHYLSSPCETHLHRSHRKIKNPVLGANIEMENNVGIAPKTAHELLVRQVGGRENIGFIPEDYKSCLRSKRTRDVKVGDTRDVLEYLHKMQFEDPNFFYAIQVDEDDLITNIFWSDAKMRADFANFGDVVYFDTTYRKNNEGRPIALFVGVNHHKQTVIFGTALLYDETSLAFEWLFDTFSRAMFGEKPKTILTDQDAAMAKALISKWPETQHRLCIWHIYQNAAHHLSSYFSEFKGFPGDFSRCIYDFEEEDEFVEEWNKMLDKYGLNDNEWLKQMFQIKEKWALAYGRQIFCADITTTQRSESMNSVLKKYVNYKHNFLEFFIHFERLIEDRRYKEFKADFRASVSFPALQYPCVLLKHAASVYTPEVFEFFQVEWCKSLDYSCHDCGDVGSSRKYEITPLGKHYHHTVLCDSSNKFDCTCRKFEFGGILCSHILKVFSMRNVLKTPSEYILKRWTRRAKVGYVGVEDSFRNRSELDPKVLFSIRYKELCRLCLQLITRAAETCETYDFVKDGMLKMLEAVDTQLKEDKSTDQVSSEGKNDLNENDMIIGEHGEKVKGIEATMKTTSGKRLKSSLEKASKKQKVANKSHSPANNEASRSPLSSCVEATIENIDTTSSIQYNNSNYYEQGDDINTVNPMLSLRGRCIQSSEIQPNQQVHHVASGLKETTRSISPQQSQSTRCLMENMRDQHNMINVTDICDSGGSIFGDSSAMAAGIRYNGARDGPVPCRDSACLD